MIDEIAPFNYKDHRISARIPPERPGLPRPFLWTVRVDSVGLDPFPAVASDTKEEILSKIRTRVDSFLEGKP
jgi:hypothetical protein